MAIFPIHWEEWPNPPALGHENYFNKTPSEHEPSIRFIMRNRKLFSISFSVYTLPTHLHFRALFTQGSLELLFLQKMQTRALCFCRKTGKEKCSYLSKVGTKCTLMNKAYVEQ